MDVSVAHHRRNSGRRNAGIRRPCTKRVPEIMKAEALDVRGQACRIEGSLYITETRSLLSAWKEKLAIRSLPELQQLLSHSAVHWDEAIAMTLSVGSLDFICAEIDMLPFESKNLASPHSGVERQYNEGAQMRSAASEDSQELRFLIRK